MSKIIWFNELFENFTTEELVRELQWEYESQQWDLYDITFEELRQRGYFQ